MAKKFKRKEQWEDVDELTMCIPNWIHLALRRCTVGVL